MWASVLFLVTITSNLDDHFSSASVYMWHGFILTFARYNRKSRQFEDCFATGQRVGVVGSSVCSMGYCLSSVLELPQRRFMVGIFAGRSTYRISADKDI